MKPCAININLGTAKCRSQLRTQTPDICCISSLVSKKGCAPSEVNAIGSDREGYLLPIVCHGFPWERAFYSRVRQNNRLSNCLFPSFPEAAHQIRCCGKSTPPHSYKIYAIIDLKRSKAFYCDGFEEMKVHASIKPVLGNLGNTGCKVRGDSPHRVFPRDMAKPVIAGELAKKRVLAGSRERVPARSRERVLAGS